MKRRHRIVCGFLVSALAWCWAGCGDTTFNPVVREPVEVRITVSPQQASYTEGAVVQLGYVVLDADGYVVDGIGATWQNPPESLAAPLGDLRFELGFGEPSWTVTLEAPWSEISDTLTLTVGGLPASVEIVVDPEQAYYALGQTVSVTYVVLDASGEQLPDIGASWDLPDEAQVPRLGDDLYRLDAAGEFTWKVTLDAPYGLTDEETLRVDAAGPGIEIDFPERGDTILKDTPEDEISVQGHVSDDVSGLDRVVLRSPGLGEIELAVQANGSFTAIVPVEPGVNLLAVQASDLAGNTTVVTRGFHYAPDFFGYEQDLEGRQRLGSRLHALLSEEALDRGQPPAFDPCGFDVSEVYACDPLVDLASLLELALNNADFTSMPPTFERTFPLFQPQVTAIDIGGVELVVEFTGDFELELAFSEIGVGLGKVRDMSGYDGGVAVDAHYESYGDHAGLNANLGLTGRLVFGVTLDLITPGYNAVLCGLAAAICDGGRCLDEYIASCVPDPRPVLESVTTISTPLLVGLSFDTLDVDARWAIFLDSSDMPEVILDQLDLEMGAGAVDMSVLQGFDVELGVVTVVGYEILDLGTYTLQFDFLQDLADSLIDPLIDLIVPVIEPVIELLLSCSEPDNPVCFVIPFFEHMLGSFVLDMDVDLSDPFGDETSPPLASVHLSTAYDDLRFREEQGGRMVLGGLFDGETSEDVLAHCDDDLLGLALVDGCQQDPEAGLFRPPRTDGKAVQIAPALDLLNMAMFAAWRSGAFDLELDEGDFASMAEDGFSDVSGLSLQLLPWLPLLMVDDCPPQSEPVLLAGLGDLWLEGGFDRAGQRYAFSGFASIAVPGSVVEDAQGVQVEFQPDLEGVQIELELGLTVDGQVADEAARDFLADLASRAWLPELVCRLTGLALEQAPLFAPAFDISAFPGMGSGDRLLVTPWTTHSDQGRVVLNGDFNAP
ncbi:MAG: hypothetical protein JXR96_28025 [Deltaproteobacteria bacterium]|nr:hypothetical protein [Deltaproteobacteria bacterium]